MEYPYQFQDLLTHKNTSQLLDIGNQNFPGGFSLPNLSNIRCIFS